MNRFALNRDPVKPAAFCQRPGSKFAIKCLAFNASWGCSLLLSVLLFDHTLVPSTAVAAEESETPSPQADWALPRFDPQSTGATPQNVASNLAVKWEFQADEAIEATPIVVGKLVFVADVMGKLYAIDRKTGQQAWSHDFETGFLAAPAVAGSRLVIGDVDGNVYAIDSESGKVLWQQTTEGEISGSAAFFEENVLVTSQDGNLYCFRAADGSPQWTYQTDDQVRCSPTIAGNRTFLGGCDGQLHVVDLRSGQSAGDPVSLGGPTGSTPAVAGEMAFLPIMDGAVLALNWKLGTELWRYVDEDRPQEYRGSAAIGGETLVVASQNKQVDAISVKTGQRKWRYTLKRRADASPVLSADDVWIASTDGRLIRLSLETGKERWSYEIRGAFIAPPAIAGGELFIADDNGVVRCFGP
ncbi:Outer membrane protein assembly factor BamB precursor [Novipirellula artificiosorum]|uniref:Outer membrane protein assembly factor BamB n=1 Tax=Novipirellula artificiosorum TaxID=2528016 RepID=A0A5C6DKY8_9BACT|nr:Outer membrane protein assembly factor BamB precursor [Novipirellula artificiosorum]